MTDNHVRALQSPQAQNAHLVTLVTITYLQANQKKTLSLCSHIHDLVIAGQMFLGVGLGLRVQLPADFREVISLGCTITLETAHPQALALALQAQVQGQPVTVALAFFGVDMQPLLAPYTVYVGRADRFSYELGERTHINLTAETQFIASQHRYVARNNHQIHLEKFPYDMFFQHADQVETVPIKWGKA